MIFMLDLELILNYVFDFQKAFDCLVMNIP